MGKTQFDKDFETGMLVITREVKAAPEKVWEAFMDPEVFAKWWGPIGWNTTVKEFKPEPGGVLHYGMKCEDKEQGEWYGQTSWGKMVFDKIDEPHGFTYTDYFCDEDGKVDDNMPAAASVMRFEAIDGGTRVVNEVDYKSGEALKQVIEMGMEEGTDMTFDRMVELLEK